MDHAAHEERKDALHRQRQPGEVDLVKIKCQSAVSHSLHVVVVVSVVFAAVVAVVDVVAAVAAAVSVVVAAVAVAGAAVIVSVVVVVVALLVVVAATAVVVAVAAAFVVAAPGDPFLSTMYIAKKHYNGKEATNFQSLHFPRNFLQIARNKSFKKFYFKGHHLARPPHWSPGRHQGDARRWRRRGIWRILSPALSLHRRRGRRGNIIVPDVRIAAVAALTHGRDHGGGLFVRKCLQRGNTIIASLS